MDIALTNTTPFSKEEMVAYEQDLFSRYEIKRTSKPSAISPDEILKRTPHVLEDRIYNRPHTIFTLDHDPVHAIVGRKLISVLAREKKTTAINCSRISASMLLGFLRRDESHGDVVKLHYHPFTDGEKIGYFNEIKQNKNCDIFYPFQYREFETRCELTTPSNGWDLTPELVRTLGNGEEHIRRYTRAFFEGLINGGETVYDPACSTGQFLSEFKQAFPSVRTIGHDLSQDMIDYAEDCLNESLCCDAAKSPLPPQSVDIMFLRFLNQGVVPKSDAYKLFDILLEKVKKNGWVICFGHTPVLIDKEYFSKSGLCVVETNGYDEESGSIFQFYAMRKRAS